MKYSEVSPSPILAAFIKCYWSLEYAKEPRANEPEPVLPDGSMEIIFNLADRFQRFHDNGSIEIQPAAIVTGQIRRKISIGPTGDVRLFGIRFRPTGAYPFFRFPLGELTDRIEDLESVWTCGTLSMLDRIASTPSFTGQIAMIESELLRRVKGSYRVDGILSQAVAEIGEKASTIRVGSVAKNLGLSERSLERIFCERVGLSPKTFARIVRFQNVLKALETSGGGDILDAALIHGFYDQSHLINDFREQAGITPSQYADSRSSVGRGFAPFRLAARISNTADPDR